MHLTADELVGPLREECSFLPSPGASLNQFASGTAKHLISLTDPQDKTEPVNYQQIKGNVWTLIFNRIFKSNLEKLEEIEPSFNPVPDFEEYEMEEVGEEDEAIAESTAVPVTEVAENGDAEHQESEPLDDQVEEEVDGEIEIVQNEVEIVLEEKVEENGVDIVNEEPIVIAQEPEISENNGTAFSKQTSILVISLISSSIRYSCFHDWKSLSQVAISETLEFVNRDVLYKEEDQIKEILTEVSSQFNFMAPAAGESDCDESDVESPITNELSFIPTPAITQSDQPPMETTNMVSGGDQLKGEFINTNMHYNEQMESPERHQVTPPKPVSQHIPDSRAPPNNHHPNQYDDSVKDELNWQQRAQAAPSGGGGPGRPGSFNRSSQGGYKNSNRYRQFNDRNNRQNGNYFQL